MQKFLEKLRTGRKVTLVTLGDSNTELTWHTLGRLNWVGYLQEALFETYGRNRCFVINAGRCGDTAAGAVDRLDEDVLRFEPDLVIICFGTNDGGIPVEEFRRNMERLIDRIRQAGSIEILLRTPNPIVNPPNQQILQQGQSAALETAGGTTAQFAETIVEIARHKQCAVVDHYRRWKKLESLRGTVLEEPNHLWRYMSDAVHPGPLGHLAFFRDMAPLFGVPSHFPWEPADAVHTDRDA